MPKTVNVRVDCFQPKAYVQVKMRVHILHKNNNFIENNVANAFLLVRFFFIFSTPI